MVVQWTKLIKEKIMENVRGIVLDWKLSGAGGVNFDSPDQSYLYNKQKGVSFNPHKNVKYHKGHFYSVKSDNPDDDTKLVKKLCVSSNCLRHHIFEEEHPVQSPILVSSSETLNKWITSKTALVRGYLIPDNIKTLKRKSALSIPSVEQISNTQAALTVQSKSGDRSNTSFSYTETFGDIVYRTKSFGFIDTDELQFVSADFRYDRQAFLEESFSLYKENLERVLGSSVEDIAFYSKNNASLSCEKGILLTNDQVLTLIKYTLKRIFTFSIKKSSGILETKSLRIRFITDDNFDTRIANKSEEDFIEINTLSDIDDLNFNVYRSYSKVSDTTIAEFDKYFEKLNDTQDAKKEAKKEAQLARSAKKVKGDCE